MSALSAQTGIHTGEKNLSQSVFLISRDKQVTKQHQGSSMMKCWDTDKNDITGLTIAVADADLL